MTKNQRIIYLVAGIIVGVAAIFAMLDLLEVYQIPGVDDPFIGFMILAVLGMSVMLFIRNRAKNK
jgi:hypothetical protein